MYVAISLQKHTHSDLHQDSAFPFLGIGRKATGNMEMHLLGKLAENSVLK